MFPYFQRQKYFYGNYAVIYTCQKKYIYLDLRKMKKFRTEILNLKLTRLSKRLRKSLMQMLHFCGELKPRVRSLFPDHCEIAKK